MWEVETREHEEQLFCHYLIKITVPMYGICQGPNSQRFPQDKVQLPRNKFYSRVLAVKESEAWRLIEESKDGGRGSDVLLLF